MAMGVFRTVRSRDLRINFMKIRKDKGFSLVEVAGLIAEILKTLL